MISTVPTWQNSMCRPGDMALPLYSREASQYWNEPYKESNKTFNFFKTKAGLPALTFSVRYRRLRSTYATPSWRQWSGANLETLEALKLSSRANGYSERIGPWSLIENLERMQSALSFTLLATSTSFCRKFGSLKWNYDLTRGASLPEVYIFVWSSDWFGPFRRLHVTLVAVLGAWIPMNNA